MPAWTASDGAISAPRASWVATRVPYRAAWVLICIAWGCGSEAGGGGPDPAPGAAGRGATETARGTGAEEDGVRGGSPRAGDDAEPASRGSSATAESAPALACDGPRGGGPLASPPGPLATFLMQRGGGAALRLPRRLAIDGILYVIAHLGTPPVEGPGGLEAGYSHDPVAGSWQFLRNAGSPPAALGGEPVVVGELDDGLLVASAGPGPSIVAIYRPGEDAWELLDDGPLALTTKTRRLLVRDEDGVLVDAQDTWSSDAAGRESHAVVVGERLFVWGGETRHCDDDGAGGCIPVGVNEDTPVAQPFMERSVHGDGRVLLGSSGEWRQVSEESAPAARFGATVGQLGDDHVLVFGGFDQPIWGPGANLSLTDFALSDGVLYDVAAERWEPFAAPDGSLVFAGTGAPGEQVLRGVGRLGRGWVLSVDVVDDTGMLTTRASYRYHPDDGSWERMPEAPVFGAARALETRDGDVLYLGYQSWLLDWDAMAYRMLDVDAPAVALGVQPATGAAMIDAWDGCQLFQWGFLVTRAGGCDGPLPENLGCDPFAVTDFFPEGVRFNLGSHDDDADGADAEPTPPPG